MSSSSQSPVITIEAGQSEQQYWKDIWHSNELLLALARRDILVRYKQTVIGAAWALIRPVVTMVIFTIVFGKIAKMPAGGVPYPILVFVALLPWQLFSSAITEAGNSLVSNANMISKVYFPRIVVPMATIAVSFIDFLIALSLLGVIMLSYGYVPPWQIIFLPFFILLTIVLAFGVGLFLAALTVKYRDFRYIIPFIVQFGLYVSPVGFASSAVPDDWQLLYALNPMVGIIDGFRWAALGGEHALKVASLGCSLTTTLAICFIGITYFRKTERQFADVI